MSKSSDLRDLAKNQYAMQALAWVNVDDGTDLTTHDWIFGNFTPEQLEKRVTAFQLMAGKTYDWVGIADGWPGSRTYCALWQYARPDREQTIDRALWCARSSPNIPYVLGGGSGGWFEPGVIKTGMDCSSFVAMVLARAKSGGPDWTNSKGQYMWLHTGSIYTDALNNQALFREVEKPRPGSIFVYPDADGKQGHTGFMLTGGALTWAGTDCSSSQSRAWGDAIRLRSMEWLRSKSAAIFVEPIWWG